MNALILIGRLRKVKARPTTLYACAPLLIAVAWWLCFVPGFYSGDSFGALGEASGRISTAYTAVWPLYLRVLTLHGKYPAVATLVNVLLLTYAVQFWAKATLSARVAPMVTILMAATPLVGAIGITLWHDVPMTSGLLIMVGIASRTNWFHRRLATIDYVHLIGAAVLTAFRPNGVPTLVLFFTSAIVAKRTRRLAGHAILAMSAAITVWVAATLITGNRTLVMAVFAQEWMRSDISCLLSRDPSLVPDDTANFAEIGGKPAWAKSSGCWGLNPLGLETDRLNRSLDLVPGIWTKTAFASPVAVLRAHLDRNAYLLPIPRPHALRTPFIHSTIEFPDRGIAWMNPKLSNAVRNYVRAWNAARGVLAFAGLWLLVLILLARYAPPVILNLDPTVRMAFSLAALLFITAPIADARYTLVVLISGQASLLAVVIDAILRRSPSIATDAAESDALQRA
jgi:hypothetical protein